MIYCPMTFYFACVIVVVVVVASIDPIRRESNGRTRGCLSGLENLRFSYSK
jgi:hypothetical protein